MNKSAHKKYSLSADELRSRLKLKHLQTSERLRISHPHVEKILREKGLDVGKVRQHSAKIIGAGALAGTLLLAPADLKLLPSSSDIVNRLDFAKNDKDDGTNKLLADTFNSTLPQRPRPLSREEEKFLEGVVRGASGIPVKASLEGEHLNTTYGVIGIEQHLRRFPGDTLKLHGEHSVLREGLAPGLGAWGYFASTKDELTPSLAETEKWYAVVQTMYLPDWNIRQPYLREWYKYRKVFIVNKDNGNSVVASIADSGPAAWTGKHYGGSPEVMQALGGVKYKKGNVLLFFVDDPENKIPLGPVIYNANLRMNTNQLISANI